ncbi:MAG: cytochrome-c peroxidase [Proteobacteria bacterium]|nr:cytochrome-c peroxidase [Pseudomonadota bacterium]
MREIQVLLLGAFFLFIPLLARSGDTPPVPTTKVNVHSLGPERIGDLPPVPVPVNNPQTSKNILLGKQLYFDTRLSKDNTISCASCHSPDKGFSDAGPTSKGIKDQLGGRRSMPVINAAYNPLQFWDGRAESLEEQAKGPIQNPVEMGNTHENALKTLNSIPGYVDSFKQVFGSTPITIDQVAQAIAAFERTVVTTDSLFDRYVRGDEKSLTAQEKMGLEIFNGKGHCTACHWGGNFSDGRFHNLAVTQVGPLQVDKGRFDVTQDPEDLGKFRTMTVRDAALRAPYLHDGAEKTLEDLLEFYNRGGGKDPNLDPLMVPLGLFREEIQALAAFIKNALTSLNPEAAKVQPIPASNLPK